MSKKTVKKFLVRKVPADKIEHGKLKTTILAGMASPNPPLGSMLGQRGINIAQFCKDFNERTAPIKDGIPLPTRATVNADRTYNMIINKPTSMYYVKQAAGIMKGSTNLKNDIAGYLTYRHVYEIAKLKSEDYCMECLPLQDVCQKIVNTARGMGVKIVREIDPEEYKEFLEKRKTFLEERRKELDALKEQKILRTN